MRRRLEGVPDASALLAQHSRVHSRLRALAARRLERGRPEEAAVYVQAAAEYAWLNHPGYFADRDLEETVARLARGLFGSEFCVRETSPRPESVLHVLTRAYVLYGHTRLCWRWIEADQGRRHSAALTQQGGHTRPDALTKAVAATGGEVHDLGNRPSGLLERVRRLRDLAGDYDAVVLHVHPYDVVSAVAFALRGPTPVMFLNHAEHVFWLGVESADLFVHHRELGSDVAVRRGVERERSVVLPIPLAVTSGSGRAREQTRRELGIGPGETMLLTVASPYKYRGSGQTGFLATVVPALSHLPEVRLVAAGPSDEGAWSRARAATEGRVVPLGVRRDVPALLEAADIYVDSFPLSSVTAVLEAGTAGLPLLRLAGAEGRSPTFEPCTPTLDPHVIAAPDPRAFREALVSLVEDPVGRRELGARTRDALVASHVGEGWLRELAGVYARAAVSTHSGRAVASPGQARTLDALDLGLSDLNAGWDSHAAFLSLLPARCRLLPPLAAGRMWLAFVVAMREDIRQVGARRIARAIKRVLIRRASGMTSRFSSSENQASG